MGLAGMAAGAADALAQMLAERRAAFLQDQQQKLQQEAAKRAQDQFDQNMAMRQQEFTANQVEREADRAYRQGQVDRQARLDRVTESERSNRQGTKTMIGDFLTRRPPGQPLTDTERGSLEAMAVTDDIALPGSLMAKPQKRLITTVGPRGGPMSKLFTDAELEQGVPEYRAPTATAREPQFSQKDLLDLTREASTRAIAEYNALVNANDGLPPTDETGTPITPTMLAKQYMDEALAALEAFNESGAHTVNGRRVVDIGGLRRRVAAPQPTPPARRGGPGPVGGSAGRTASRADVKAVAERLGISEADAQRQLEARGVVVR